MFFKSKQMLLQKNIDENANTVEMHVDSKIQTNTITNKHTNTQIHKYTVEKQTFIMVDGGRGWVVH